VLLDSSIVICGIGLGLATLLLCLAGHRVAGSRPLASLAGVAATTWASWLIAGGLGAGVPPLAHSISFALVLAVPVVFARREWNPLEHLAAVAHVVGTGALLLGTASWIAGMPGFLPVAGGIALLALQAIVVVTILAGTLEMLEANCAGRRSPGPAPAAPKGYAPRVSLHVPIHDEPPGLVIETLSHLARLDYPDFEVLVVDNNTPDESLWRPVEAFCRRDERFRFFHLDPWPGYKAGALNFALGRTDPDAEIVGIVDADYQVEPDYLRDLVGHFAAADLAFVQTPQDYRDAAARGRFGRALYFAYLYFFKVSMAWRDRFNGIIFAGTMGLLRRRCLEEVGGWDEWCITEDAELSLRILDAGYRAVYVDRTYGRGLMPMDYAALKRQRFRWAFGGMQILRIHWRRLLFPSGSRLRGGDGHLAFPQRVAYLVGGVQWLSDPITLCFTIAVLAGLALIGLGQIRDATLLGNTALLLAPVLILTSLLRFAWALRTRAGCSWRDAMDGLTVLLGLSWTTSIACLEGLVRRGGVFLRTPKQGGGGPTLLDSFRVTAGELWVAGICLASLIGLAARDRLPESFAPLALGVLLAWNGVVYLSSLQASLWSHGEPGPETTRMGRAAEVDG
jgi:cellulose synthase/poly-beta-1,6-N-acetylglucosamine synthase-like glycosyltransferase